MSSVFLKLKEVIARTGLSRSCIYREMDIGLFPKQIKIGKRSVAWRECDVMRWIDEKSKQ